MRLAVLFALLTTQLAPAQKSASSAGTSKSCFDVSTVNARSTDLAAFGQQYDDADIIVLDEVCSLDVVNAALDKLGTAFAGFHTACSDFAQNDADTFNSLEVGIISRFPLANVVEFDQTRDNTGQPGEPAEQQLTAPSLAGIEEVSVSRGSLTADVPALGITLLTTHLKSSQGSAGAGNHENAKNGNSWRWGWPNSWRTSSRATWPPPCLLRAT
jgi:hypothetical protein